MSVCLFACLYVCPSIYIVVVTAVSFHQFRGLILSRQDRDCIYSVDGLTGLLVVLAGWQQTLLHFLMT